MIEQISDVPENIVAFRATGEVTRSDFETIVIPAVDKLLTSSISLNYLMVIDTPLENFTAGAWFQDALMGLKKLTKWRRAAILVDSKAVRKFTEVFSVLMPGEFRGFEKDQLQEAIDWVSA